MSSDKADKNELERTVRTAERAQRLLDDDLFKASTQQIRDEAVKLFTGCDPKDLEGLRHARLVIDVTERFVNAFVAVVNDGKMANHKLFDIEASKAKTKRPVSRRDY